MKKFMDYLHEIGVQNPETAENVASLRPTLYIGLGGFGCTVVRRLKAETARLVPGHVGGFGYLGLDTHNQPVQDVLTVNEYLPLGVGIDPQGAARDNPDVLGWFPQLMGAFKAHNIQAGANKIKAVGRLALRFPPTFAAFQQKLDLAANQMAQFRQNFAFAEPAKVYVISTLAGGTGAGCLLDVLATVGTYFRRTLGADFPYQAILATPEGLLRRAPESMREFYANTYASLKELHHFWTCNEDLVVRYDETLFSDVHVNSTVLPNPLFLIGTKNESGSAVANDIEDVADVVVAYLLSEIQTPMHGDDGQPKVQDMENPLEGQAGYMGMPRVFSSFGVVRTGIPIDVVGRLFLNKLLGAVLQQELAAPAGTESAAETWIGAQRLEEAGPGVDHLQDLIKTPLQAALNVSLDAAGELLGPGLHYDDIQRRAEDLAKTVKAAQEQQQLPVIGQRRDDLIKLLCNTKVDPANPPGQLISDLEARRTQGSLGAALDFGRKLESKLKAHRDSLVAETVAARSHLTSGLEEELDTSIKTLGTSVKGYLGRARRVKTAVGDFEGKLELVLQQRAAIWVMEAGSAIFDSLLKTLADFSSRWSPIAKAMEGHRKKLEEELEAGALQLNAMADIGKRGPGNRFSMVDGQRAKELYEAHVKPVEDGAVQKIRQYMVKEGLFSDTGASTAEWAAAVAPWIFSSDLNDTLGALTFSAILDRFYPTDGARRALFQTLRTLASPLFWLDPGKQEAQYSAYWIIGVSPEMKRDFAQQCQVYLQGLGAVYAYFDSPHEVILYQFKTGYTGCSNRGLANYEAWYRHFEGEYQKGVGTKQVRPVHGWVEAQDWEELRPDFEADDALRWFILGLAFGELYPAAAAAAGAAAPAGRSRARAPKGTYIFKRGSYYYLETAKEEETILIGSSLREAVANFGDHRDWQQIVKQRVETQIGAEGATKIRERLENEYVATIEEAIDTADQNKDGERLPVLRKLLSTLKTYIKTELQGGRI